MSVLATAHARLAERCTPLAAPGTDPDALAAVLAYAVRPRRTPDQLRRALLQVADEGGAQLSFGPERHLGEREPAASAADPTAAAGGSVAAAAPALPATVPSRDLAALARRHVTGTDLAAADTVVDGWLDRDCRIALIGDPGYPSRLAEGWPHLDVPTWLVRRGRADDHAPTVAVGGARRASAYGRAIATWLGEACSAAGVRVVSGGAVGIDAAAHRAALDGPGGTVVVLGCGHAVDYPRPHAAPGGLFEAIRDAGGELVGELLPEQRPRPGAVRARNRLVAGLADVTVVVEGGARSGALLTADAAAGLGRPVLAVPGDVRAPGSQAPHQVLRDGGAPCTDPQDVLDALPARPTPAAGAPDTAAGPDTTDIDAPAGGGAPPTGRPSSLPGALPPVHAGPGAPPGRGGGRAGGGAG
ncbi:MAG: DNA-protecting protein DprA [Nitriliruptoraceae bacterium]|nr:DNA-protecting protein DprA [Nitriliruptoraceae bacterium]